MGFDDGKNGPDTRIEGGVMALTTIIAITIGVVFVGSAIGIIWFIGMSHKTPPEEKPNGFEE
jgi:hypothetical protein